MAKRLWKKTISIGLGIGVLLAILPSPSASEPTIQNHTELRVTVSGQKSGTNQTLPIAGADVLVRSDKGDFEATPITNSQGVANVSEVPFGKTLIQVTAPGWISHGHTYALNKKEQIIQVQLNPAAQESPTPTPTPTATATPTLN